MTTRPPIALVKREHHLFISGILAKPGDDGLLRILFIGQGKPHQAYLGRLQYGPVGEGDTYELAAQALVEKLQADTLDFPAFLLALADGAEAEADVGDGDALDDESLEQDAVLLRILAGLAAQAKSASDRERQLIAIEIALDDLPAEMSLGDMSSYGKGKLATWMFDAGWRRAT